MSCIIILVSYLLNLLLYPSEEIFRSLNVVINKVPMPQLDVWFNNGLALLSENPEGGLAYFKLESQTSEQTLEGLSSSVVLEGALAYYLGYTVFV